MNKAFILGRVGTPPELVTTGDTQVAKFSLATNKTWKDKNGEKKEKTTWHFVDVWGNQADVVMKYFKKGSQILIEGEINNTTTGEGEARKYFSSITCQRFEFVGSKPENSTPQQAPPATIADAPPTDNMPF